jgi:cytochrome b involved in lipid metabolism
MGTQNPIFFNYFFMKSFFLLLCSLLLLTSCGQEGKLSNTSMEEELASDSPIIGTSLPTEKTSTPSVTADKMEPQEIAVKEETESVWTITKTSFTASEVANHNSASDCWLILDNKVYDVTNFIPSHPGGKAILKWCGKDATEMFAKHKESAKAMKEKFYIGELQS